MLNKNRMLIDSGIILVGLLIALLALMNHEITWLLAGG